MKSSLSLFSAFLLLLPACTTTESQSGVYRPTLSTQAKTYLQNFPLNEVSETEIVQTMGTPDKSYTDGPTKFVTINIAPQATGVIEYTYEITRGYVTNVRYLNSGNFFGVTQRESAKELQSQ